MVISGLSVFLLAVFALLAIQHYEQDQLEEQLRNFSQNELKSLDALVFSAMDKRRSDRQNVAIDVFNRWFESRNADYPGKLWTAWGPRTTAFMAEDEPGHAPKRPQDAIDEEAIRTGKIVARFVGETYRYSVPIVQGVTPETEVRSCKACHANDMKTPDGETIAVYSSSLNIGPDVARMRRMMAIMAGAALAVTLALVLAIRLAFARIVNRPLTDLTGIMGRLAAGDLAVAVPHQDSHDETGDIARAVQVFKSGMVRRGELEQQQQAENEARRQRTAKIEAATAEFDRSAGGIVTSVADAATRFEQSARDMSNTAASTTDRAATVALASEQASANVQAVASAAEQLTMSINEIGRQVGHSSEIARHAVGEATRTEAEVGELASSVARIGDVVTLINDIASQTNLLALNATIEAARAGEAGKGFAVVANEVKNLANQTARATGEIGEQIAAVQGQTERVVTAIKSILGIIAEVGEIAAGIASAVQQQTAATREIAGNVEQVAAGTAEVSRNVADVRQAADATGRDASELLDASRELAGQSARLRAVIDTFLGEVARA